jgi:hypothetical protein
MCTSSILNSIEMGQKMFTVRTDLILHHTRFCKTEVRSQ